MTWAALPQSRACRGGGATDILSLAAGCCQLQVCQVRKEGGSNPEFFRFYAQLASAISPIMMASVLCSPACLPVPLMPLLRADGASATEAW